VRAAVRGEPRALPTIPLGLETGVAWRRLPFANELRFSSKIECSRPILFIKDFPPPTFHVPGTIVLRLTLAISDCDRQLFVNPHSLCERGADAMQTDGEQRLTLHVESEQTPINEIPP
jgi:hypothetical protein